MSAWEYVEIFWGLPLFRQTIALFRYQLRGIVNRRIVVAIAAILLVAFIGSRFVAELAIINSEAIASAAMADFLRYSLLIMLIISICYQVSQDYELHQFERLLAMPVSRNQYVFAQLFVLLTLSLVLTFPVFLLMSVINEYQFALYWSVALFLEMILVGQFAILAILSLEKLPVAVIFTFSFYLLAKAAPLIDLVLNQSSVYYDEETGFQLSFFIFTLLQYVLPEQSAFAQNNVLLESEWSSKLLLKQLVSVLVYGVFIQFVILLDFYRKEFNRL